MSRLKVVMSLCLPLVLLMSASTVSATTLSVNCAAKEGLHSIGAALKVLQNGAGHEPSTINVFGACHENVVIQSLDRLTLNAVNGGSVFDASGGALDVISVQDSRDVSINGFRINAGAGANANGISCNDYSLCRLSGNLIQGAGNGGFAVFGQSKATLDGDTLQNNNIGLLVRSGSGVRAGGQTRAITARANGQGINIARQAFTNLAVVIENSSNVGALAQFNSTMELTGSISGNASAGVYVREASVVRLTIANINGNAGPGVLIQDLSMVTFNGSTVTGNGGGTDVVCAPQFAATRGTTTDIGGGSTNCVEP